MVYYNIEANGIRPNIKNLAPVRVDLNNIIFCLNEFKSLFKINVTAKNR